MDCRAAGSPCACAAPGPPGEFDGLLLASRSRHVLAEVQRVAEHRGGRAEWSGAALVVRGPDVGDLVDALDVELSSVEKDDVRAVTLRPGQDADLLAEALTAPTLSALCARRHAPALSTALGAASAFHSEYQPVVDLLSGAVVAWEALLRAEVDGRPLMPSDMFVTAERAGWLHVLDRIGRESALRGAEGWLGSASLFVNFIPTSIYRPQVCLATTERAARSAGLRMDQLVFEVVESHAVADLEHLVRVLDHYKALGCRVALDDVGAGYSSLNALVRVQPQVVKLDRELVHGLTDRSAVAVVRSVVTMAHDMGAVVVAECVETEDQVRAAVDLGVDLAQGWWFARPSRTPWTAQVRPLPVASAPAATPDVAPQSDTSDSLLRRAVQATTTGVTIADARADMPMTWCNDAFQRMSGYGAREVIGRNCRLLQSDRTDRVLLDRIAADLAAGRATGGRLLNVRPDGTEWWNDLSITPLRDGEGRVTHFVGVQQDVTALVRAEEHAAYLAQHDALTGLANRAHLHAVLGREVARAERGLVDLVVVFADLDGFKAVNDQYGHVVGDEVLAALGARLQAVARDGDVVARVGGDEFVVVVVGEPGSGGRTVDGVLKRLHAALQEPVEAVGRALPVSVSTGVAVHTAGMDVDALLDRADAAMYAQRRLRGPRPQEPAVVTSVVAPAG